MIERCEPTIERCEYTLTVGHPVAPQRSAAAEVVLDTLFGADRALPVDGIDYTVFRAMALIVDGQGQWCGTMIEGRPLPDLFHVLRRAGDSIGDFKSGSRGAKERAALPQSDPVMCRVGHPGGRIILVVTNRGEHPQPFAIRVAGRFLMPASTRSTSAASSSRMPEADVLR